MNICVVNISIIKVNIDVSNIFIIKVNICVVNISIIKVNIDVSNIFIIKVNIVRTKEYSKSVLMIDLND